VPVTRAERVAAESRSGFPLLPAADGGLLPSNQDRTRRWTDLHLGCGDGNMVVMKPAEIVRRMHQRTKQWERIRRRHPQADPDVIWQTLVLLEQPPIERLRGGLQRGQVSDFRRT
jgi:hypothetical protein